jgi:hypothetical protein
MQKIVSIKRKKEKNNSLLEIASKLNDNGDILIENVSFNTIKFENIFSLIKKDDEIQVLELLKFSVEKLNQIKQFDDYFNKSVEKTLQLILEWNIEITEVRDNFDDFYTYIRRFLMTYKPEHDTSSDSKHEYYITILKILIKFANINQNFLTCLVEHGVFDQVIAKIRYINDYFLEKGVNKHLAETFAYSLKLMFKLSLQEKYVESVNNSLKTLLSKNLDNFLKMKMTNVYFEFTETIILSNLMCFYNCILNEKDKIDIQLLSGLIELCKKLVFEYNFEEQDFKLYKIIKNEIDIDVNCFQIAECLVSIERFVKFIELNKIDAYDNQFIKYFYQLLESNKRKTIKDEKLENKIDLSVCTQFIEEILNNSRTFDFEKFKIIVENYKIIKEERLNDLIKFMNCNNIYNSKFFHISDLNIFDKLIGIAKSNEHNIELITFIFKIFIRKCIIGNDSNFKSKYQNIVSDFFLKFSKTSDILIKMYFKFEECLNNENLMKTYKDYNHRVEIFEIFNENKANFLFDEKIKDEMVKDLIRFYEKYNNDKNNEYLFGLKVILDIMFDLVKNSNYNNFELKNFLKNFIINKNNELLIDLNPIVNEILILIDKQYVFKTNIEGLLKEHRHNDELDNQKISNILSIHNLKSLLMIRENIQEFKSFIKMIISGLNRNIPGSQPLFLKAEYLDNFIKLYEDLKKQSGTFDEILELNEVLEFLTFLIFKIFLRKTLLDSDTKGMLTGSFQNIRNTSLYLVKSYFSNQIDKNLIKDLIMMIHTQANNSDDVFVFNSFEIYEYFNLLFKKSIDNGLSDYLRTEFFDKKCFEVLTKNLVNKANAYNCEEQLEDLLDLKSILKLLLNFFKRFNLPSDSNLLVLLKNFKPIDSQYVNLNPLVEELINLLEISISTKNKNKKEQKISTPVEEILVNIYECAKYLKTISDRNDSEVTRSRYVQIRENLLVFVQNSSKFDDEFISKLETELEINKIFYHLIKLYFDFIKDDLNDLLEMIIILIIKFTDCKDYSINSYQNHDCVDNIDILDYLLNSIIIDRTFLFKENINTIRIIQIFFYLLYKLATSNYSKEILRVKFKKLNLYHDILQRLNYFKKYSCSNLIYILSASLIDKTEFNHMIYSSSGIVSNGVLSQFKIYLKYYLHSIHDSTNVNVEIHPNGSLLYNLTNKLNLVDNYCYLNIALHYLADFIEMDSLLQKYFCCLCIDDDQYLNIFFKIFQFSNQTEEKLEAIRIIWLLIVNKKVRNIVKNEINLVYYLKDCTDNHSSFNIRTYCGAILYNISNELENDKSLILSNKNSQKREMKNNEDDDFDTTFVKLSIQETNAN